jgi:hypothetical protein
VQTDLDSVESSALLLAQAADSNKKLGETLAAQREALKKKDESISILKGQIMQGKHMSLCLVTFLFFNFCTRCSYVLSWLCNCTFADKIEKVKGIVEVGKNISVLMDENDLLHKQVADNLAQHNAMVKAIEESASTEIQALKHALVEKDELF